MQRDANLLLLVHKFTHKFHDLTILLLLLLLTVVVVVVVVVVVICLKSIMKDTAFSFKKRGE